MDSQIANQPRVHDARALPAPPVALWLFAALLTVSALWAVLNA